MLSDDKFFVYAVYSSNEIRRYFVNVSQVQVLLDTGDVTAVIRPSTNQIARFSYETEHGAPGAADVVWTDIKSDDINKFL